MVKGKKLASDASLSSKDTRNSSVTAATVTTSNSGESSIPLTIGGNLGTVVETDSKKPDLNDNYDDLLGKCFSCLSPVLPL